MWSNAAFLLGENSMSNIYIHTQQHISDGRYHARSSNSAHLIETNEFLMRIQMLINPADIDGDSGGSGNFRRGFKFTGFNNISHAHFEALRT